MKETKKRSWENKVPTTLITNQCDEERRWEGGGGWKPTNRDDDDDDLKKTSIDCRWIQLE